jgi:hypothetical protein
VPDDGRLAVAPVMRALAVTAGLTDFPGDEPGDERIRNPKEEV